MNFLKKLGLLSALISAGAIQAAVNPLAIINLSNRADQQAGEVLQLQGTNIDGVSYISPNQILTYDAGDFSGSAEFEINRSGLHRNMGNILLTKKDGYVVIMNTTSGANLQIGVSNNAEIVNALSKNKITLAPQEAAVVHYPAEEFKIQGALTPRSFQ